MTDDQLIHEARRGSRHAFEALFERYRGPIWQFFRRRVPQAARAEELAQDTFVALLEGAHRYEAVLLLWMTMLGPPLWWLLRRYAFRESKQPGV